MNARDYLDLKQQEFPSEHDWSPVLDEIWENLGTRIPLFISKMREDGRLSIGVISEEEPRIYIRDLADRNYAIIIHEDLPQLIYRIYRITRAILSQIKFTSEGIEYDVSIDEKRFAQVLADILWWFWKTGSVFGPDYPINQQQTTFAGILTTEAETFLIAHELGHLIVNPGKEISPDDLIERLISGAFVGFMPSDADRWDEEYHADILAFNLVMGITAQRTTALGWKNQLRYADIELMIQIQQAMENLGFNVSASHPPATQRLGIIREYARSISVDDKVYERLAGIAGIVGHSLTEAVARIQNVERDHAMYTEGAEVALKDIGGALSKYSARNSPQYFEFYDEMNRILSRGYDHVVLEEIADFIRRLAPTDSNEVLKLEFEQKVGKRLTEEKSKQLRGFWMYKLMIGYFRQQANPMGWYMMNVLEV